MRKLIWMLAAADACARGPCADGAGDDRPMRFFPAWAKTLDRMTDGDYQTYWASSSNGSAYVEIEAEDAIGGVYVQFYDDAAAFDVQTRDASGAWQTVAQTDGAFWRRMRRWTRAQKPCGFARRTGKGGCLSLNCVCSAKGRAGMGAAMGSAA